MMLEHCDVHDGIAIDSDAAVPGGVRALNKCLLHSGYWQSCAAPVVHAPSGLTESESL